MVAPTLSTGSWLLTPPIWIWGSLTPVLMTLLGMFTLTPPPPAPWPWPGLPRARYLTRPICPRPTGSARSSPTSESWEKSREKWLNPNIFFYHLLSLQRSCVRCLRSNWILISRRTESDWLGPEPNVTLMTLSPRSRPDSDHTESDTGPMSVWLRPTL